MACKDSKQKSPSVSPRAAASQPTMITDREDIRKQLVARKDEANAGVASQDNRQERRELEIEFSDRTLAIGRRTVVIDQTSYDGTVKDALRMYLGRYWATGRTSEELIYTKKTSGIPFKFIEFNFSRQDAVKITDIVNIAETSAVSLATPLTAPAPLDSISVVSSSYFGTKQWVLIEANSPFYSPSNALRSPIKNDRGVDPSTLTPKKSGGRVKEAEADLTFNDGKWHGFLAGTNENMVEGTRLEVYSDLPAIQEDIPFRDHAFELPTPFSHKELQGYAGLSRPLQASIEPYYNFLVKQYEANVQKAPETLLPNLYVMLSEVEEEANDPDFQNHITLANTIKLSDTPVGRISRNEEHKNTLKLKSGQYFDKYGREFAKLERKINDPKNAKSRLPKLKVLRDLQDLFRNISVPMESMELLKRFNDRKRLFPMYTNIEFSTDRTTVVAEILKDAKMSTLLQKHVIKDNAVERDFVLAEELVQQTRTQLGSVVSRKAFNIGSSKLRTWDLTKWVELLDETDRAPAGTRARVIESMNSDVGVFLGGANEDVRASSYPSMRFYRSLLKLVFTGKLRKLVKERFRTFEEMIKGKLAYSETVMYRIEKSLSDDDGRSIGEPLQNFYLPNANEIDVLKFIDTQVKYGRRYAYTVYAYQVVIGTEYAYSDLMTSGKYASFMVSQVPSIQMVETPYYRFAGMVIDAPPVAPEVDIIPYRANNHNMLFNLGASVGIYKQQPIIIESADIEAYELFRREKGLDSSDPLEFRTDDHSGVFQIFRIETHPKSYLDFQGAKIADVKTDIDPISPQTATAASYVDTVKPNTKYYYTFRVVDIHGHISRPTAVYRVELLDDNGTVIPLVEVVDFASSTQKAPFKTAKKYIQIAPALPQTMINEEKSGIQNAESVEDIKQIFLGQAESSVWGKSFKVRLTSKNSGKQLDININFGSKDVRVVRQDEREQ